MEGELAFDRFRFDCVNELESGGVCLVVGDKLDGEKVRGRFLRIALCVGSARVGMDFVIIEIIAFPLDEIGAGGPVLHLSQGRTGGINEIGIVGDVGDDLDAGLFERVAPFGLDRAGELNEVKAFDVAGRNGFAQGFDFGSGGVKRTGIQSDDVLVVCFFCAGMVFDGLGERVRDAEELETAVVRDEFSALSGKLLGQRGVVYPNFMGVALRGGGRDRRGIELGAPKKAKNPQKKEL